MFPKKETKVSLYQKIWSLSGINTISKSKVFNCIGGKGNSVLYCMSFVVWCYSNKGCRDFVWRGIMVGFTCTQLLAWAKDGQF